MAEKQTFPVSVYNKDGAVLQVNTEEELKKAKAKNYNIRYVYSHFPKMVYNKTTGGTITVANETELQAALGGEFTEDYVAPVQAKVPLPAEPAGDDSGTVRALLAEIHDMKNQIEDCQLRLDDLEVAAAKAAKEKPAKPAKPTA